MQQDHITASVRPLPTSLMARAVAAGAPASVAIEAMRVTSTRFAGRGAGDGRMSARAEAYFWGVIRRSALRGAAPAVSRLLVIASLERELRDAGHTPEAVRRELTRLYGVESCSAFRPAADHAVV